MTRAARILVVEDDPETDESLTALLTTKGYEVKGVIAEQEALGSLSRFRPDLILLELGLSNLDGCMLCRRLRLNSDVPIIMLSAPYIGRTRLAPFEFAAGGGAAGSPNEILVRIRAAIRQVLSEAASESGQLTLGALTIDFDRRRVRLGSQEIRLTPKEFELLVYLGRQPNRVITNQEILTALWGTAKSVHREQLWTLVTKVRKKLEPDPAHPRYLLSEPWVGYRLAVDIADPSPEPNEDPLSTARQRSAR